MAYKQNFGSSRASRNDKTKQITDQSVLFKLGAVSPLNHESTVGEHQHNVDDINSYTYQANVEPSVKNVSGRDIRNASKYITELANQGINTTGYSKPGSNSRFKINLENNNKPLLDAKLGSRGAVDAEATGSSDVDYSKIKRRDVKKILKNTGSVSVIDGVVSTGTSSTETRTGSVSTDNRRVEIASKKAAQKALIAQRKIENNKKRAEFAANKQALIDARREENKR